MHLLACLPDSLLALCNSGAESASMPLQLARREKNMSGMDMWLTVTLLKRHKRGRGAKKEEGLG